MDINWNSYAPSSRKRSTQKMLIMRTYTISSNDSYLKLELQHLQKVFHEQNAYPHWFITKVMNEVKRSNIPKEHFQGITKIKMELPVNEHSFYLILVKKGCSIVRSIQKQLKRSLPNSMKPNIVFTGTKLSYNFNVKDPYHLLKKVMQFLDRFMQLKAVMRTMLVNALEGYMSV